MPSPAVVTGFRPLRFDVNMARRIVCGDGIKWMMESVFEPHWSVVTSLPDTSEMAALSFEAWKDWFVSATQLICEKLHETDVAIFFQTDIKRGGRWVDKSFLVQKGAERAASHCLFHKIVCRAAPGQVTFGRPAYAHLLAFSKSLPVELSAASADVLPGLGEMTWARAMGVSACVAACTFLKKHTSTTTVVDPFCGYGTVLAVAEHQGFDTIGVELSPRRARKAQTLQVDLARSRVVR
jgi:hypothetical protein